MPATENPAQTTGDDLLSVGFLIGLLAGEGHFGGDGRQPHVTLRMHTRHEATFRWLERTFPGGRLYGPYTHGGRSYFQWMARGAYLREQLAPLIHRHRHLLDEYVAGRFDTMCQRYTIDPDATAPSAAPATPPADPDRLCSTAGPAAGSRGVPPEMTAGGRPGHGAGRRPA